MNLYIKRIPKRKLILLLTDIIIVLFSLYVANIIRFKSSINFFDSITKMILILFILSIYLLSFYIFDLYNIKNSFKTTRFVLMLIGALILVSLFVTVSFYLFPFKFGRGLFLISLILIGILIFIWRMFFSSFFRMAIPPRKVVIIGAGKAGEMIYSLLKKNPEYKIIGFIEDNPKKKNPPEMNILGDSLSLQLIADEYKVNDIVLSIEPGGNKRLSSVLINCRMRGINIYDMSTFYENLMAKLPVLQMKESWFLYCSGFDKLSSNIYKRLKRTIDFMTSFILLVFWSPFIIVISLLIKLTSSGPIFFIQERLGENKNPFNMIKFRTMGVDAEKIEPKWAEENDFRVTKIGKILRKTRFDELPQLINVIKGEMSLIGPRPEREFFVNKLMEMIPYYSLRFAVKPGLTGWAQVNYRYGSSIEDAIEKLRYELYYIKNQSLFLDLRIILKTFRVVLFGLGR